MSVRTGSPKSPARPKAALPSRPKAATPSSAKPRPASPARAKAAAQPSTPAKPKPRTSPRPRQRPGTAVLDKGRQSAAAALDAAASLLAEEGAAGLSTRKVAARAGMHAGNLQYYFRTKRDLVRALLERHIAESRERVVARLASVRGSAKEKLLGGIDEILADQDAAAECALFRELWAMAAHDPEIAGVVGDFYRGYVLEVAGMLRDSTPRLAAPAAARIATLVVATIEGLSIVDEAPGRTAADRRRLAGEVAEAALALVRAATK